MTFWVELESTVDFSQRRLAGASRDEIDVVQNENEFTPDYNDSNGLNANAASLGDDAALRKMVNELLKLRQATGSADLGFDPSSYVLGQHQSNIR